MSTPRTTPHAAAKAIKDAFARCGWTQSPPDPKRRAKSDKYKRGYEVRFSVPLDDVQPMLRLLESAGFQPGKPNVKGGRARVPVYGREQVARLLQLANARNSP